MLKWTSYFLFKSVEILSKNKSVRWNHYKTLGLPSSASLNDIKTAYYKLSKIYHPDKNNGCEESAKRFRRITAAYEVLSKPDLRKQYDKEVIRKYEALKSNYETLKKGNKQIKKTTSKVKARSKIKHQSTSKETNIYTFNQKDLENLMGRAIPLVVACMMCYKKR